MTGIDFEIYNVSKIFESYAKEPELAEDVRRRLAVLFEFMLSNGLIVNSSREMVSAGMLRKSDCTELGLRLFESGGINGLS